MNAAITELKNNLAGFVIFLLAGVLLALGIRAAMNPEQTTAPHDHGAMHEMPPAPPAEPAVEGPLIDLGNELCPIMKKKMVLCALVSA